jgi:GntR family transcriptional regulator
VTRIDWQLDAHSMTPLHQQFQERISSLVRSGIWQPGEQIPSERELMQLASISRATVRQALAALVHDGILEKEHGRGTFVRRTRFEQPLTAVYSFSQQLQRLGVRLEDTLLERKRVPATVELAQPLNVEVDTPLICIRRLRRVGSTPMMVSIAYLPFDLCPDLLHDDLQASLYRQLTEHYHLPIFSATDRLEAVAADAATAQLLDIPRRSPLMYIQRIAYTTDHVALHVGENYIRGDMCSFRSDMQRQTALLEFKAGPSSTD